MQNPTDARLDFIPLSEIHYNPAINARRETETDVSELAATIDAQNIGQPLLLRPSGENGYEPVDGGRRLRALKLLVEQGRIQSDHQVPAYIRELSDTEALSLSLATVITRLGLHPADEALDFADLNAKGIAPEEIAARFGIPLRRVRQRLAIGKLPADIIQALKSDKITLASAQAYTLLPNQADAIKLFRKGVTSDWDIRQVFAKARIAATSMEARYVGREAYVAAGGAVDEDLFSNNVWFADGKLLSKLFREKLKADEEAWLADGWSFVIIEIDKSYGHKTDGWPYLEPEGKLSLTQEQKFRADELRAIVKKHKADLKGNIEEEAAGELRDQLDAAQAELSKLTRKSFTDAQKKKSGVAVRARYGELDIEFGVMKPKAARKDAKKSKQTAKDSSRDPSAVRQVEPEAEADFTQALSVEMAKTMTHAMQRAMMEKPSHTLRLAVAVLTVLSQFSKPEGFAFVAPYRKDAEIGKEAAEASGELLAGLGAQDQEISLLAVFAALENHAALDDVIAKAIAPLFNCHSSELEELRPLINAFDPSVISHWQPDAEFFKRMPRESLAAALSEAAIAGVTPSKKKKDLIEMAVRDLVPLGWLPKPLRTPGYAGPGSNAWADAHAEKTAAEIMGAPKEQEAA